MSVDKLVDSTQLDADLTSVANAIRAKSGGSGSLAFPAGFVSEIGDIPSGGGSPTLTKLAELEVQEPVATLTLNLPSAQVANCNALYVVVNLSHSEDWLYPSANNIGNRFGYTTKRTTTNGVFTLGPLRPYSSSDSLRLCYGGSLISYAGMGTFSAGESVSSVKLCLYSASSTFNGGTVQVWGYV